MFFPLPNERAFNPELGSFLCSLVKELHLQVPCARATPGTSSVGGDLPEPLPGFDRSRFAGEPAMHCKCKTRN